MICRSRRRVLVFNSWHRKRRTRCRRRLAGDGVMRCACATSITKAERKKAGRSRSAMLPPEDLEACYLAARSLRLGLAAAACGEGGRGRKAAAAAAGGEGLPEEAIKPSMLVTLVVRDAQRRTVTRTMRRTDKLRGLMYHYYSVVSPAAAGRFLFDGTRLNEAHTPEDLNMVTGDKIDFIQDVMTG
ncbi:hypothetical protein ACP4OV_018961 [Aristida adscensionis]